MIAMKSEFHVELGGCQQGVAVGGALPAYRIGMAGQTFVHVHFLAVQVGHAEIDAHVLIDVVGGAGAVPDTVGVRNAQAAVFRLDRAVVVGEADAGFPGRVDVPGTTDGVAGGILELLVFLQADPTGAGVAGGLELLEGAPVGPVDGVVTANCWFRRW